MTLDDVAQAAHPALLVLSVVFLLEAGLFGVVSVSSYAAWSGVALTAWPFWSKLQ